MKTPTFRMWGKKLLTHKRALIVVLLICIGANILNTALRHYFSAVVPCEQPCQDASYCDALELTFEIEPKTIKLGQPYFLWYRARLTNRTCRLLRGVSVNEFLFSDELSKGTSHLWVSVKGPDGQAVARRPVPEADGGISWKYGRTEGIKISTEGAIYPYQPDFERIDQLQDSEKLWKYNRTHLAPGESFETITPVLRPYRMVAWSYRGENGGIGDGYRRLPVDNPPSFPTPPKGFNSLDRYKFIRPGRYTIHAGFADEVQVYPVYSRWDQLSPWLQSILRLSRPNNWKSFTRKVDIVATPTFIEVSR